MEKRTLTIEEMIAAGASWADISTRVKEMQREHEKKKKAKEAAARAKAKKAEIAENARERLVTAFVDWGIAEGFIPEAERNDFAADVAETMNVILAEMRQAIMLKALFEQR